MIDNQITINDVSEVKVLGIEYSEPVEKGGPVEIVVFNDFECLYCGEFYKTINKIKNNYSAQVVVEIKHFPLPFHQEALKAAMAYECASEQGVGELMAGLIYQARVDEEMGVEFWKSGAANLGVDTEQFNECLDSDKYLNKIEADIVDGENLEVSGTPTTFIENEKILGNIGLNELGVKVRDHLK